MKTLSYLKSLAVLTLGVCLAAPVLKAIPLNFDTSGVGYYAPASQANNNTEVAQAADFNRFCPSIPTSGMIRWRP